MRREKRRAEFEARYRADQERKRAAKRKRKNREMSDGVVWKTNGGAENLGVDSEPHKTAPIAAKGKSGGHPFKRDASFTE